MRILPPGWFFLAIAAMFVLHLAAPVVGLIPVPWNLAGFAPMLLGVAIALPANRLFHQRGTPVRPLMPATTLVLEGPFRYTRNPMYLGLVLFLIGVALLMGTLTPWLVIPPFVWIITGLFIRREEAALEAQFGDEYVAYRRRVRRWM